MGVHVFGRGSPISCSDGIYLFSDFDGHDAVSIVVGLAGVGCASKRRENILSLCAYLCIQPWAMKPTVVGEEDE